jgi:hypothetical protein
MTIALKQRRRGGDEYKTAVLLTASGRTGIETNRITAIARAMHISKK